MTPKKIMCTHESDKAQQKTFESDAVRFEVAASSQIKLESGWLDEYRQVQIDHCAN